MKKELSQYPVPSIEHLLWDMDGDVGMCGVLRGPSEGRAITLSHALSCFRSCKAQRGKQVLARSQAFPHHRKVYRNLLSSSASM